MKITLLIALSAILGSAYAECGCPCVPRSAVSDCVAVDEPGLNNCGCANGDGAMCIDAVCNEACVCPPYRGTIITSLPIEAAAAATESSSEGVKGLAIEAAAAAATKSSSEGVKGVKGLVGGGIGVCDCEGGLVELRYVYLGTTADVKIEIFTGKRVAELICSFEPVQPGQEIVCNLRGGAPGLVSTLGLDKFDTESPFIITYPNGNTCAAQIHTSCSSDIVGIAQPECDKLVVSGWKDNKNYGIGDCDDGIEPCRCGIMMVETVPEPEPEFIDVIIGDQCYCEREITATRRLKGSKSTGPKRKLSSSSSSRIGTAPARASSSSSGPRRREFKLGGELNGKTDGVGVGDCDCDGGQMTLKLMYQGVGEVDVQWFHKDGPQMCENVNVQPGDEIECNAQQPNVANAQIYEKLGTNTYVRLFEQGTTTERCQTEIHTSCSRDIVGTYGDGECGADLIVTGWKDTDNLIDGLECDDGFDLCDCDDPCRVFSTVKEDQYEGDSECETQVGCYLNAETGSCADRNSAVYSERQAIDENDTDHANSQNYFVAVVVSIIATVRYF